MTNDDAIFSPRPDTGRTIQPTQQQLNDFLESAKSDATAESHVADLIRYRRLLYHVENYESRMQAIEARPNAGEQAFYGALSRTRLCNRSLLLAVGTFKYHLRDLAAIDADGPVRFIESAAITMKKLSKRKINDVMRMGRLQEMVNERKLLLEKLRKKWADLSSELLDIALYVIGNLVKIERLCGRSLSLLKDGSGAARKERQLVEEIKALIKSQLRDALIYRPVTTEDVAKAKKEVDLLAATLHSGIVEDVGRLTTVFESVRNHAQNFAGKLEELVEEFRGPEIAMDQEQVMRFRRIEQALVALLSGYPLQLDHAGVRPGTGRILLVENKRQEMVAFLLEELQKQPPARPEKRSKKERRKGRDPNYTGPERRSGRDRRSASK